MDDEAKRNSVIIQSRAKATQIRKSHSKLSSGKVSEQEEDYVVIQRALIAELDAKSKTIPASLAQSKAGLTQKNETAPTKFLSSKAETDNERGSRDFVHVEEEIKPIGSVEVKAT